MDAAGEFVPGLGRSPPWSDLPGGDQPWLSPRTGTGSEARNRTFTRPRNGGPVRARPVRPGCELRFGERMHKMWRIPSNGSRRLLIANGKAAACPVGGAIALRRFRPATWTRPIHYP